jgi:hypothetical protein
MPACAYIEACKLLNQTLVEQRALAAIYLDLYCHGRPDVCARRLVLERLGPAQVPNTLFPNQTERADLLIRSG